MPEKPKTLAATFGDEDNMRDALANHLIDHLESFMDVSVKKLRTIDDEPSLIVFFGATVVLNVVVQPLPIEPLT